MLKSPFYLAWFPSRRRARRTIVTLIASSACLTAVGSAKAGLFDELFGVSAAPESPSPELNRRYIAHRRHAESRTRLKNPVGAQAPSSAAGASPKHPQFCSWGGQTSKPADRTEALMRDATVRPGDVIMTDEGVRVFAGRAACPHTVGDFQTLAEARALPRVERTALAAIEQATKAKPFGSTKDRIVASDPGSRANR